MDNEPPATPPPTPPPLQPPAWAHAHYPPAPQPRRSGGRGWVWLAAGVCLLAFAGFAGLFLLGFIGASGGGGMAQHGQMPLQEVVVKDNGASDKIAVIPIEGIISSMGFDATGYSLVDYVKQQLERAAEDDDVKAVLLKVDSPGGEVLASDDIYHAIKDFQDDHGKPVVAVMTGMAASGGYYVAAPCRWIVAHELTMTGSIGVIMQGFNFRGLMDKVGVQPQVFKSGKFKDMMGSMRKPEEVSPEEEAMMQQLIDEAFGRFKTVVSDGRKYAAGQNKSEGRALAGNWTDYADGRILTGKQAHEHGFVDELGSVDDAVKRALKIAGISNANLVRYQRLFTFANFFSLLGKSEPPTIKVDVGFDLPRLEAGRMYFLPGHFLP